MVNYRDGKFSQMGYVRMLLVALIVNYYPGLLHYNEHCLSTCTHILSHFLFNIDQAKPSRVEVYLTLHKLSL